MPAFWLMFAAIVSLIATLIVFRQRQSKTTQPPKIKAQLASNPSH